VRDADEVDWFEEVHPAHEGEIQRFRRAIRRAGDQFGFYVFIARPTLHDALLRRVVQAGVDELKRAIETKWIEGDDLRVSVEALLQRRGARYEGLALPGDALVAHSNGALIAALNLARERLAEVVDGPLVLCLSADAYAKLPDLASDLWSARSGTFFFDGPSRLRTTLAVGDFAGVIDGGMYRVPEALLEQWTHAMIDETRGEIQQRAVFRWRARVGFLLECERLNVSWVRPSRLLADRAHELQEWETCFQFRHAELCCRQLAGQSPRGCLDSIRALAPRLDREVRPFAAMVVALESASDESAVADALRGVLRENVDDSMEALNEVARGCRLALEKFGPSEEMLRFSRDEVLPRIAARRLWQRTHLEITCMLFELRLERVDEAIRRADRCVARFRALRDEVAIALVLKLRAWLDPRSRAGSLARRECLAICRRLGLRALEQAALAVPAG
jgi:hypothetical protein